MAAAINMSWAHRIGENNNNKRTRGLLHSSGVFTVHAHIYCVAFVKLPHITCILCGKTSKRATPEFKLYRKLLQHVVYRISRDDDNGFLYRLPTLQVDPRECSIHALLKNNIYAIHILWIKRKILYIFFYLVPSRNRHPFVLSFTYTSVRMACIPKGWLLLHSSTHSNAARDGFSYMCLSVAPSSYRYSQTFIRHPIYPPPRLAHLTAVLHTCRIRLCTWPFFNSNACKSRFYTLLQFWSPDGLL